VWPSAAAYPRAEGPPLSRLHPLRVSTTPCSQTRLLPRGGVASGTLCRRRPGCAPTARDGVPAACVRGTRPSAVVGGCHMARWRVCADGGSVDCASVCRFGLSLRVRMLGGCRLLEGEARLGGRGGVAFWLVYMKVGVTVVVGRGFVSHCGRGGAGRRAYLCLEEGGRGSVGILFFLRMHDDRRWKIR